MGGVLVAGTKSVNSTVGVLCENRVYRPRVEICFV